MTAACCAGMAHFSTNPASATFGGDRFIDPECLIHPAQDGQMGIIIHDDSGRYSIIRFCPWCGTAVGPEADEEQAAALKRLRFVEEPPFAQGQGLPPRFLPLAPGKREGDIVRTPDGRPASAEGDALPAYQDEREGIPCGMARLSHKKKPSTSRVSTRPVRQTGVRAPGKVWGKAARQAASERAKAAHQAKRTSATSATSATNDDGGIAPGQDDGPPEPEAVTE